MIDVLIVEDDELAQTTMVASFPQSVRTQIAKSSDDFRQFLQTNRAKVYLLDDFVPDLQGRVTSLFETHYHMLTRVQPDAIVYCTSGNPSEDTLALLEKRNIPHLKNKRILPEIQTILTYL